jgi:divalent metal cation (Fe/Co/Zn/Cd) transporter
MPGTIAAMLLLRWQHLSEFLLHFTLAKGYEAADDWAALFASGFILYNSYKIFRPALGEIMDEHVYDDLVANIRKIALTVNGVMGTEKCFIRKAGMIYHVDLHALTTALKLLR